MMDGDLSWGGEPTIECTDDVLNCAPETGTILLISITPINSRKKGKKKRKETKSHSRKGNIYSF